MAGDYQLESLQVEPRTFNALAQALGADADVGQLRDKDLLRIRNFGRKSLRDLRRAMLDYDAVRADVTHTRVYPMEYWEKVEWYPDGIGEISYSLAPRDGAPVIGDITCPMDMLAAYQRPLREVLFTGLYHRGREVSHG